MHVDDTHLTYAGSNLENIQFCLNEELTNVFNWLQANKLTIIMTKTEFMLIGSRQRLNTLTASPTIRMNNTQVSHVTAIKSLGVIINNYSPKWRWLAVDIYRAAKRRGKYPTLATDTEVNSCFSIY